MQPADVSQTLGSDWVNLDKTVTSMHEKKRTIPEETLTLSPSKQAGTVAGNRAGGCCDGGCNGSMTEGCWEQLLFLGFFLDLFLHNEGAGKNPLSCATLRPKSLTSVGLHHGFELK